MRLEAGGPEALRTWIQNVTADGYVSGAFEDLAQRAVQQLYAEFADSIVLARMYVTVPFAALPEKNASWVRDLAEAKSVAHELDEHTQVISLVGSAGRVESWNDRRASNNHIEIPMTSASFIDAIPMMSRLMA
jgi:hypothetical protein